MSSMTTCTAASLRAILCFIDANNTPKIAFDKDEYAIPLAEKIKEAVGDKDGSQLVCIRFNNEERELLRQFNGICSNIKEVFHSLEFCTK